jgi:hypothetical protein
MALHPEHTRSPEMNVMGWTNGPQTAAHALKCISDGDLITAEGVGSDWDWRSEVTVADAMQLAAVVDAG